MGELSLLRQHQLHEFSRAAKAFADHTRADCTWLLQKIAVAACVSQCMSAPSVIRRMTVARMNAFML